MTDIIDESPSKNIEKTEVKEPTADEILDYLLDEAITMARETFYTFVKLMSPEILPEDFIDGRHIEVICNELQAVEASVANPKLPPKRLQIFLPPGSMKSRLGNLFCAWCLGKHPNWCFLAIASDQDFAMDNYGRPIKDLIDTARYQAIFPDTILKKDVQAAGRWDTTQKGRFVAKGVGQGIAGRRAHISIVDDAVTEQTTGNDLKKINGWYIKGLRTRLLPRGAEIIINTRWYVNDLSGHMEKVDAKSERPWKIIRIPALLTQEGRDILWRKGDKEERYAVGTSFWPEFWPTETLLEKKATTPPSEWNALYMQNPIAETGSIVRRDDFKIWKEPKPPNCKYVIVSWDTAFSSKETADYSAYTVWGVFKHEVTLFDGETKAVQSCMILLDCDRGRWDFAELCNKAQELDQQYQPDFMVIEDKASGQSLIPELRKRGVPVMPYMPERDKIYRLQACTPYFQAGRIWVPEDRNYVEELIDEVVAFPKGPNDDRVDTVSQAILWMRDTINIDNDGYSNYYEDEDEFRPKKKQNTYWGSLFG